MLGATAFCPGLVDAAERTRIATCWYTRKARKLNCTIRLQGVFQGRVEEDRLTSLDQI